MSTYLETQVAVYRHLLARHVAAPEFRFSLRQLFSRKPGSSQGLFIGTEQSRYFAFTLWQIPIGFPGSAMDLIDYIIRLNPDGTYALRVEFLVIKDEGAPGARLHSNTLASRDLIWELQRQTWPAPVEWVAAPAHNRMLQLTFTSARQLPDVPALLAALDALLDATQPGIDKAVAAHAARTPGWIGQRIPEAQFVAMRQRAESRCAGILAGQFPVPIRQTVAYWCAQVAGDSLAWASFRRLGEVAPRFGTMPTDGGLNFAAGTPADLEAGARQLREVQPHDVVVVVDGPRQVLGVGIAMGRFSPTANATPPFACSVEWVLTESVTLNGTPFLTGVPWSRTHQWDTIRDAYAAVAPDALAGLEARLVGAATPGDAEEPEAGYGEAEEVEPAYWWLNINPTYWGIDDFEVGQEQIWTTHNEKGNKRTIYKYFQQVEPGDLIIGYETTPTKRVKAVLEVVEGIHLNEDEREIITFTVKEFVREELTRQQLVLMPELAQCEPLIGAQGSLFKLTPAEFEAIVARAQRIVAPALPPYTHIDAAMDLFLTNGQITDLKVALKRKKNLIVQGPPGVGKTYVARRLAWLQMGEQDNSRVQLVQFHQSYSYEDFIRGWRPTEKGGFELANGVFVEFVRKAQHDQAHDYFFIIDEINRGNLSKIFGELLMLLEADKRDALYAMPLTYRKKDEAPFYLPPNLYVIGTMNTADRSLAMVDYALRRRFTFVDLVPMLGSKLVQYLRKVGIEAEMGQKVVGLVEQLNVTIKADKNLGSGFLIGHSYFCTPLNGAEPQEWWDAIVRHDIAPLLREYWFDNTDWADKAISALQYTNAE